MKRTNIILLVLLVSALSYLFYVHTKNVNEQLALIYDVPGKYTMTSPDADVTILDFNNYNCEHCRTLHPVLKEAMERDGRVRYISRTVSWADGDWGKELVSAPYAAGEQGKFIEMHDAIYENWPVTSREELFEIASEIGLDTKKLSRDLSRSDIQAWADTNFKFFKDWGIRGTPTLIIGKKFYRPKASGPTVEGLLEQFDKAR